MENPPQSPATNASFISSLFDFSFSSFITTKIIKLLYILSIIGSGIFSLILIGGAFSQSAGAGLFFLVISPIIFLFYVAISRVWLELVIVIFRVAEYLKSIDQKIDLK